MPSSAQDPSGSRAASGRQGKPPIWADGRQRPPFDGKSFWRVTLACSRDALVPLVGRAAEGMERAAIATACGAGAATVARLGRAARVLPPRRAVVAALRGTGLALGEAALRVAEVARSEPVEALDFRGWSEMPAEPALLRETPARRPVRPVRSAPLPAPAAAETLATDGPGSPAAEVTAQMPAPAPAPAAPEAPPAAEDAMAAIRALMIAAAPAPLARPAAAERPAPAAEPATADPVPEIAALLAEEPARGAAALPPLAPPEPPTAGPGHRLAGRVAALAFLGVVLPYGAAKAGLALVRGEDLRLRET